jgi:uncharacterized membrane protein YidH (DUF202 family)
MSGPSRYTHSLTHYFVSTLGKPNNTTANERTFLAWIRTSVALSMLGTVIAQLFRLQNAPSPPGVISLYILAIPLACICQGAALLTALTGGHRYWRMQNAMVRGQALAAGWEYWLMIGVSGSVSPPHLISTRSVTGFTDDREGASNTLCCYTRAHLNVVVSMTRAALVYATHVRGSNHWDSEIGGQRPRYITRSSNSECSPNSFVRMNQRITFDTSLSNYSYLLSTRLF